MNKRLLFPDIINVLLASLLNIICRYTLTNTNYSPIFVVPKRFPMMKYLRFLLYAILVHVFVCCSSKFQQVQICGDIGDASKSVVYASLCIGGQMQAVDSCEVSHSGKFRLICEIDNCEFIELSFSNGFSPISLLANPGEKIDIEQNNESYKVSGSYGSMVLQKLQQDFTSFNTKISEYSTMLADSAQQNNIVFINSKIDSLVVGAQSKAVQFIKDNPYSLISMMLLNTKFESGDRLMPYFQYRPFYRKIDSCLNSVYPDNYAVKQFTDAVRKMEVRYNARQSVIPVQIGQYVPALEFTLVDSSTVNIPGYWGRIFLLDFQADWNETVQTKQYDEVFETYKLRGLKIIQLVSAIDVKQRVLLMQTDSIPWNCAVVGDPKLCDAIGKLGIVEFPCNFVIDRRGRLLAKDIYGAELQKFLEQNLAPIIVHRPKVDTVRRVVDSTLLVKPLRLKTTLSTN